jgi:hypothetical protein
MLPIEGKGRAGPGLAFASGTPQDRRRYPDYFENWGIFPGVGRGLGVIQRKARGMGFALSAG